MANLNAEYENMAIKSLRNQIDWCRMEFHEQLRQRREGEKLTQEQVAKMLGIAKTTYIGYEKGEREPRLGELKKMATVFKMTLSQLCMESDSRSVDESLVLMFEAVRGFDEAELKTFSDLVESMVIRHHANEAKNLQKRPENSA